MPRGEGVWLIRRLPLGGLSRMAALLPWTPPFAY